MTAPLDNSPNPSIQIDGQDSGSWRDILAGFSDASIYQSWAYGAIRWQSQNLSHCVLRHQGEVRVAAQLRIVRVPLLKAGIAYLRWGPLCRSRTGGFDANLLAKFLRGLQQEYCVRRGLCLQIIPHVWLGSADAQTYAAVLQDAGLRAEPSFMSHHRTVVVGLAPEPETLRKSLDKKWRNQLNAAEKNGLTLEISDQAAAYGEFLMLYQDMMERKQFDTSVDVHEFGRIQETLADSERMRIFLARKDGAAIGALVCSLLGDTAIYLLGATNLKARELKAAYFLQWQTMLWLKAHGALGYDLGGIDPVANPGGYHFKSGLGGADFTQLPMHTCAKHPLSRLIVRALRWRRQRAQSSVSATSKPAGS